MDAVKQNAELSLSASVFSGSQTEFSRKSIEKTARDFEKMRGLEISDDNNNGVLLVFKSEISDLCILLLLIVVGLSLITDEKDKRLFHLIRSAKNGTAKTIFSKLAALLVLCVFINLVITATSVAFAGAAYGFGDIYRSIQSVPEMLTCFLRLNVAEFFFCFFAVKTAGIFIAGMLILLFCLITKRPISMLVSVLLISAGSVALTFIPETSAFHFFKYINLYSCINPYSVLSAYHNLNVFGEPVNVIAVFAAFCAAAFILFIAADAVYFIKKRPLENSGRKSTGLPSRSRVHGSIAYFELKKLLSLNKAAAIILIFALFQCYAVYHQQNFQSSEEYYYKHYMEMLSGSLTDEKETIILSEKAEIDEAEKKTQALNRQKQNNEISLQEYIEQQEQYTETLNKADMFNRVYERYLYIKENPQAEFVYDTGYEEWFGISNANFSMGNTLLMLCVFSLCFCSVYSSDYKNDMYKIICAAKYGAAKTRCVKAGVLLCLTAVISLIAYLPEVIYVGRFYGFDSLGSSLISIPAMAHFGTLPIWFAAVLLYLLRFVIALALIPIISAISLKSKNNILTAVIFLMIFAVPIAAKSVFGINLFENISLWGLLSGKILTTGGSVLMCAVQFVSLIFISAAAHFFVKLKFGKTNA